MQIVIDIDNELYQMCKDLYGDADPVESAIANGTQLPKGHGRLKDVDHYIKMQWEHPDYSLMDDEPTIIEAESEEHS